MILSAKLKVTADVVGLYPSIPHKVVLNVLRKLSIIEKMNYILPKKI